MKEFAVMEPLIPVVGTPSNDSAKYWSDLCNERKGHAFANRLEARRGLLSLDENWQGYGTTKATVLERKGLLLSAIKAVDLADRAYRTASEAVRNTPAYRAAIYARQKEYRAAHPEKDRVKCHRRRALKAGAEGHHTLADLELIWQRQNGKCAACKASLTKNKCAPFTRALDHIIPLKRGGSQWPQNLQWLCRSCNSSKQAQDPDVWAKSLDSCLQSEGDNLNRKRNLEPCPLK